MSGDLLHCMGVVPLWGEVSILGRCTLWELWPFERFPLILVLL